MKRKDEKIKLAITLILIVIAFSIVISFMLKYNIEGETNMPFMLTDIIVVSSGEGVTKKENPENNKWNLEIMQYNDIYLQFSKNYEYKKNAYIEKISIGNFKISSPKVGKVKMYMPSNLEGALFSYDDKYLISKEISYIGEDKDNLKRLEICAQGGNAVFRVANTEIGDFVSNEDSEIAHDGTLISKTQNKIEDLKMRVSFEILVETNISKYRGTVNLELPCGNVIDEGTCQYEKKDCSDIIFKRENE